MTAAGETEPTFGGWRRPSSYGIGPFGPLGLGVVGTGLVLSVMTLFISRWLSIGLLVTTLVVALPLVWRDEWTRTGYQRLWERIAWRSHKRRRSHLYVAGPLARTETSMCPLPGLGAAIEAFEFTDGHRRRFAVLHHPTPGHCSVVLECEPPGTTLIDPEMIVNWVGSWGGFLAGLGYEAGLVAASVTVETSPDTGVRLREAVTERIVPDAPAIAAQVMHEIVDTYPGGSAQSRVYVTLTWSRTRKGVIGRQAVADTAVEIGSRLPALSDGLGRCGAGRAEPLTLGELSGTVRSAYDPHARQAIDEIGASAQLDWADSGPVTHEGTLGSYLHDGAESVTWCMGQAPESEVHSGVLKDLMAPHREVPIKRVTLLYRPYSRAEAAEQVRKDVDRAMFRRGAKKRQRARDDNEVTAAKQAETEEARGAGLVRFGMMVTATRPVNSTVPLERMVTVVEQQGTSSHVRIRRVWRAQESSFLAALPLGLVLPAHLKVGSEWGERV